MGERLDRLSISALRKQALRAGMWFSLLRAPERALIDLTIRYVVRVRSPALAMAVARVLEKVLRGVQLRFWAHVEAVGRPVAQLLANVARGWGHPAAHHWVDDHAYVRLLGLHSSNSGPSVRYLRTR